MAIYADVEYFIELYMSLKRSTLKNQFIKLPKDLEKFTRDIAEVVDKIIELHADSADFLKFMFKYYSPMRIVPSPRHLLASKAIMRYQYHQSLKNIYVYDNYSIDGDDFFIHETFEIVSYRNDIMIPVDKDLRLKGIIFVSQQKNYNLTDKDKRDIIYAIIKLQFLEKPVPEELFKLKEKITERRII